MREAEMALLVTCLVFGSLLTFGRSMKVYDWQRDFGNDVTHEFAQVLDAEQHILHSSTDTGATSHVPAISLINYNFTNEKFDKGIMAVRPLLSDGNQLCFVSKLKIDWETALSALESRHKMTVASDDLDEVSLRRRLPQNIDLNTVNSISDFCDVDKDHIFYLAPKSDSMSMYNASFYLQTAFRHFHIGIEDEDIPTVFGTRGITTSNHLGPVQQN